MIFITMIFFIVHLVPEQWLGTIVYIQTNTRNRTARQKTENTKCTWQITVQLTMHILCTKIVALQLSMTFLTTSIF